MTLIMLCLIHGNLMFLFFMIDQINNPGTGLGVCHLPSQNSQYSHINPRCDY